MCLLSSFDLLGRSCKCPDRIAGKAEQDDGSSICQPPQTSVNQTCRLICNQGLCKFVNGQPKCKCPNDYDGEFCEHYRCSGYCKNRGVCYVDASKVKVYSDNSKPPLKCRCPQSWTGDRCETPVANCTSPCYNGVCTGKFGNCICNSGFTGPECRDCDELHCENNGICRKNELGNAQCECTKDFKGIRCENSPCEGFCSGHGQCVIHDGSVSCQCDVGYWGKQCELEECTDYCLNGGTCNISPENDKICTCMTNYLGTRCENYQETGQIFNDCNNFQCENGGTCHIIKNMAYCNCTAQFAGPICRVSGFSLNFPFLF